MKSESSDKPTSSTPKRRHNPNLERDKVLDAALDLLNETGFEGLTLRKLADRLGVKAAALYWHFTNKQDLINHLAARIFQREFDVEAADLGQAHWRDILSGMGHGFCDALMRYRDGAQLIASADLSKTNENFKGRETVISALISKGMPKSLIYTATFSIIRYTLGYVFEEQTDPQAQKKGSVYLKRVAPRLKRDHPDATDELIRLHNELSKNPRYLFEQGLDLLLDGVEKKFTAKT
jgi:TetR/AcrR family transcriptional regulator, tetracycline repressor protein